MKTFFKNFGVPEEYLNEAVKKYEAEFSQDPKYKAIPFDGIPKAIEQLSPHYHLSIITSNTTKNISRDLGAKLISKFKIIVDINNLRNSFESNKAVALRQIQPEFYVGDTKKDQDAAKEAGIGFLGVNYGWEITQGEINHPRDLVERLKKPPYK